MTEHKTLNTVIHAAFRRDLARFDRALASFPAGSQQRADQLVVAWDNFSFQLDHHHHDEEELFWPTLKGLGVSDDLFADLGGEHARMLVALGHASESIQRLGHDPTAENAASARGSLSGLSDVLLNHLEHEERDLEPLSAANKETPAMKAADKEIQKRHKGNAGMFVTWLLDGADAGAKAQLKEDIPPPVVFVMVHTSGRRYTKTIAPTWA